MPSKKLKLHLTEQYDIFKGTKAQENKHFYSGASDEMIFSLEALLNLSLPHSLRTLLLTFDGSKNDALSYQDKNVKLLSCDYIYDEFYARQEAAKSAQADFGPEAHLDSHPNVKPMLWSTEWIPFAKDINGTLFCIDMTPAPNGFIGQVISIDWNQGFNDYVASSINHFLAIITVNKLSKTLKK